MTETDHIPIGFVGSNGHHYLWQVVSERSNPARAAAICCDGHDDDKTRQLAERRELKCYDSIDAMFDDFQPKVVNVGTIYGYNAIANAAVLERGLPVVSDKPIAATYEQLTMLHKAIEHGGENARLITELNWRCEPAAIAAKHAIATGAIGPVVMATARKSYRFGQRPDWYGDRSKYGSTILWVASHGIDIVEYVTGLCLTDVSARHGNVSRPDYGTMEDHAALLFGMEQNATAIVHADLLRPAGATTHGDDQLRIIGGCGQVEMVQGRCTLIADDEPPRDITDEHTALPVGQTMMNAALGLDQTIYNTQASLRFAAVLLACRDAADHGEKQSLSTS